MQKYTTSKNAVQIAIGRIHFGRLKPLLLALIGSMPAHAALVAGWDFQTITTGGTAVAAQPNTPRVYNANFGSGTIYLDGSNGSSDWLSTQFGGFAGTAVNAGSEFSTATTDLGVQHGWDFLLFDRNDCCRHNAGDDDELVCRIRCTWLCFV